jgi:LPS-assembly lipoprotein
LRAGACIFLLFLSACGFRPLYGPASTNQARTSERLASVSVSLIPDRTGQLVRNALLDRINIGGQPAKPEFVLDVDVNESIQNLAIQRDETATRANLILQADFRLVVSTTRETVFDGSVQSVSSYNISTSQDFATLSAETNARRRGALDLADEITARVAIFLART